jgi:predicted PurR-regulated permease PerM
LNKNAQLETSHRPNVTYAVFLIIFVGSLLLLSWRLSDVLLLLFGSIIIAVSLRAFSLTLQRRFNLPSKLTVGLAVTVVLIFILLFSWLIGDRLIEQADDLKVRVPEALLALTTWMREFPLGVGLLQLLNGADLTDVPWTSVANLATKTFSALGSIGLMTIVGIYLAANPDLYRNGFVRLIPVSYRVRIDQAMLASGQALLQWLLGQSISMLFVGIATGIGLMLVGAQMPLTLGLIAGIFAFIPFFGPIASGLFAVVLAFMQGPTQALYVLAVCVLIQQIEGNLLMPLIQRWAVRMPPVLGITAAVIFGLLFGLPGVILATPLMVIAIVLIRKLYIDAILERS